MGKEGSRSLHVRKPFQIWILFLMMCLWEKIFHIKFRRSPSTRNGCGKIVAA